MTRKGTAFLAAALCGFMALGERAQAHPSNDQLNRFLRHAFEAYENEECLRAYPYLYAYKLTQKPGKYIGNEAFFDDLDDIISYCYEELWAAVRTKQQLDEYGQIVRVTVDASGSADSGQTIERTYPYRPPNLQRRYYYPPRVPTQPPQ